MAVAALPGGATTTVGWDVQMNEPYFQGAECGISRRSQPLPAPKPLAATPHHIRFAQVSAAMLLANLSSLPAPGGDSIADPADTLRDMNAFLGLLVYVPEPTTAEDLATLLSLKVGLCRSVSVLCLHVIGFRR